MNASTSSSSDRISQEVEIALEGLSIISSCCAHQKSLVDDILTMSKMDSNLLANTPIEVRPSQCMDEVFGMFRTDALMAGVELKMVVDKTVHENRIDWLMFDPSRVKQILINLVGNAIKFTRHADIREVEVRMYAVLEPPNMDKAGPFDYFPTSLSIPDGLLEESEWGSGELVYLQFSVRDTGRGISEQEQQRLFQRYSQASPKTHIQYGGSGLGLFITRQLTELQGGEIGMVSREYQGSTFAFYIQTRRATATKRSQQSPSDMPNLPDAVSAISLLHATSEVPSSNKSHGLSATTFQDKSKAESYPSVLIVEDNLVNQKVLRKQLERLRYRVSVAGHGLEALQILQTTNLWLDPKASSDSANAPIMPTSLHSAQADTSAGNIDIVLMDIEMPVMDGLTCTRAIRDYESRGMIRPPANRSTVSRHYRLPIISTSANIRQEQITAQMEAGIDDIMTKPFKISALLDKIQRLVFREEMPAAGHA